MAVHPIVVIYNAGFDYHIIHTVCACMRKDSLIEYIVPFGSDKGPCQRLTDGVASNGNDGGGGVLFTDIARDQTIIQIPETHSQVRTKRFYRLLPRCLT